jgi:glyoxylase-like metal-dependent hydrolase (beta-lactamase superfamily II)
MELKASPGCEIVAPEADFQVATFDLHPAGDETVYRFSNGGPEIKSIHTPGHTPGSTCYLIDNKFIVTGDTVFIFSIGRPDLGGMAKEWSKILFDTMTNKISSNGIWESLILPATTWTGKRPIPDLMFTGNARKHKTEINSEYLQYHR